MQLAEVVVAHSERAVVRAGDVFIKIETNPRKAERELEALAFAPVPVPAVVWKRLGQPSLIALERVDGRPLDTVASHDEWAAVGRAVRRIHDAPRPNWEPWIGPGVVQQWLDFDRDWLLANTAVDSEAIGKVHAAASGVLGARVPDLTLTHRDLQAVHVLLDGGAVSAVLDWGDVGVGDPLYDVAVVTSRHKDRLPQFLAGYGEADTDVVRGWWAERHLGEIRWMLEHDFDAGECIQRIEELAATLT